MPISYPFKPLSGSRKEKAKYGVLLTLETTEANEAVYYTDPADNIDLSNVKMYWDYDPVTGKLGAETHDNSKVYSDAGEHYLVLISDDDLKFPHHFSSTTTSVVDISRHLIQIDKYKEYKPLLIKENFITNYYFSCFDKLTTINTSDIFDKNITNFNNCFQGCSSLTSIPEHLFDNNTNVTNFSYCFQGCSLLTSIPDGLFDNNTKVTDFKRCFYNCSSLTSIPEHLFDNNTNVTKFNDCFQGCSSLISIPQGLFDNNTKVTDFDRCFYNCSSLTSIPDGLFNNNEAVNWLQRLFRVLFIVDFYS